MIVDIAPPQQQIPELFNRTSSTHKRISTAKINADRTMADELGKKADQILGRAPAVVDYHRQPSMDFSVQHAPRLNIVLQSRANNPQVSPPVSSSTSIKNRDSVVTVEQLVPLILKLVTPVTFTKLPTRISKHLDHVIESREAALALHRETTVKLSDDENDDEENRRKIPHSDSDEQVSASSEPENDDELNLQTFSLMNFLPNIRRSPVPKRSPSPIIEPKSNKRKVELIRSFSSSLNIPIDMKQPTLPIAIPTHLFFDQSKDDRKRHVNGYLKDDNNTTTDIFDHSPLINGVQPKKSKTSHVFKQEPALMSTLTHEEPTTALSNEFLSATTVRPITVQPKKEKPTANVKPLLQSTINDSSLSSNSSSTSSNPSTMTYASTRANYLHLKLRNMSTKELNTLAREKKKQADEEKHTFEDVKQSMSLYLESVCYFIQCAHDEPIPDKRSSLLTATLAMLQHLAYNYPKRFHISNAQSTEVMTHTRPKFLLINYWLQSYIYQLQFNAKFAFSERSATRVSDYFNHSKSPSDVPSSVFYDFSKYMLNAYHSNSYWNKADLLTREEPAKRFAEQLLRQNQNQRLARDDSTSDFLLYIFDAIDLLRLTTVQ